MYTVGQKVEFTAKVEFLGTTAHPGDRGTVEGVHAQDGNLTVKLDNGRSSCPRMDEVKPMPSEQQEKITSHSKTAIMLSKGDVIMDPQGGLHRVTEWETYPLIAIYFKTDTGLEIRKEWYDPSEYDVLVPRPDDAALAQLRAA
ncbi:hypothetical protein [Streptomyces sp. NPDC055036]